MPLYAKQLDGLPAGPHYDRDGLKFIKYPGAGGKWVFRYRMDGTRPEIGLGGYPDVSLSNARAKVAEYRQMIKQGRNPKYEKAKTKEEAKHHFKAIAESAFKAKQAELKGDGKNGRWFSPLERHVIPRIGKVPITKVDQNVIKDCLTPIWHEKAPTASKAMDRIGIVIKHASNMGLDVDLNATTKARGLLGKQRHTVKPIPMMPYQDVAAFYQTLCPEKPEDLSPTKLLLRMLILTGIRTNAVRLMKLSEIEGDVWTAPGPHLKGGKDAVPDYRVPLTDEMLKVIEEAKPFTQNGYVFAGPKGKPIADVLTSRYMAEREMTARPHGFRKTLRTWLSECTDTPYEIKEFIVEHDRRDVVAKVYDQTDYLEKRRPIMQRYTDYVLGRDSAQVIRLAQ